jgi:hypothetical protein
MRRLAPAAVLRSGDIWSATTIRLTLPALLRQVLTRWLEREDIGRIEETEIWPRAKFHPRALQVVLRDGRTRPLRPSIWCGSAARQQWLDAVVTHLGPDSTVGRGSMPA